MAEDPYRYFRLEAKELHGQLASGVLELERADSGGALTAKLLRLAHTLKGAARVVKLFEIADRAHAFEDILSPCRDNAEPVDRTRIDALLACLDAIESGLRTLGAPAAAGGSPAGGADGPAAEETRAIRADIAEMDAMLDGVMEIHAAVTGLQSAVDEGASLGRLAESLVAQSGGQGINGPTAGGELLKRFRTRERQLAAGLEFLERELQQLRDAVEQIRLVGADTLFTTLERATRDVTQTLQKSVVLSTRGDKIRLDSHVLATLQPALVQIVRNAVAHGIERPAERLAAGKPATGRIEITVARRAGRIQFECRDDGRGIDLDAVRAAARKRGMPEAEASGLGADAVMAMLLKGGLSTSQAVTSSAGRGIGLNIVREAVDRLCGDIAVESQAGAGCRFRISVPPSTSAIEMLKIQVGDKAAAIPLDSVVKATRFRREEISLGTMGATVPWEQSAIPFMPLAALLNGEEAATERAWTAVVLRGETGLAAIGVDRLLGTARLVVRPLPPLAPAGAAVSGATLDSEGNPQLVLDAPTLVEAARSGGQRVFDTPKSRLPLLVIDDSLTTRMLEKSILESAGYVADIAQSAEEGLDLAHEKRYGLVLCDVEMPGMDGFTFVERLRADPNLRQLPSILVTSRSAPADRERGRKAGAQGYVVKSEFDQAALLAMIERLSIPT